MCTCFKHTAHRKKYNSTQPFVNIDKVEKKKKSLTHDTKVNTTSFESIHKSKYTYEIIRDREGARACYNLGQKIMQVNLI